MSIEIIPGKPVPPAIKLTAPDKQFTAYLESGNIVITQRYLGGYLGSGLFVAIPKTEFSEFVRVIEKEIING